MNRNILSTPLRLGTISVVRRRLRLRDPLATASATHATRDVVLIEIVMEIEATTVTGIGEASPLPGWTRETVEGIGEALARIEPGLWLSTVEDIDHALPWLSAMPVLRFGIEGALLDGLSRHAGLPLCRALARTRAARARDTVPVQFTLGAMDATSAIERLARAADAGYTHAKLKVGVQPWQDDLVRIERIGRACPRMTLRLDANGAWHVDEALRVLDSVPSAVALVEQPVDDALLPELLSRYDGRGPLVAADESCAGGDRVRGLIRSGRVGAVIVKPSIVGGLLPASRLFELAARHGVQVIISNLMESAVGRSAVTHLAAAWPELPGPHGLATGAWFETDVAAADRIRGGRLAVRPGAGIGLQPGDVR